MEPNSSYPTEAIKEIAESVGIASLNDDSASVLANDVEFRIKEIVQEAVKFMRHGKRTRLTIDDINYALRVRNVEPLYGFNTTGGIRFNKVNYSNQELFYLQDKDLPLDSLISKPLPPAPVDMSVTAHWLSVEGVQPTIPQNPIEIAEPEKFPLKKTKLTSNNNQINIQSSEIEVKPLVKHKLSRELRVYFEGIASALIGDDVALQESSYEALRSDAGLHQLLPYFVQYVVNKTTKSLGDLRVMKSLLKTLEMILLNKNFFVAPYLHHMLPIFVSSMVADKLGSSSQPTNNLTHWDIRHQASELLMMLCSKMEHGYPSLKGRLVKTFLRAIFDPSKSPTALYGAILGISKLGPLYTKSIIATNLAAIGRRLAGFNNQEEEVQRCVKLTVEAIIEAAKHETAGRDDEGLSISELNQRAQFPPLAQEIIRSPHFNLICQFLKNTSRENAKRKKMEA